MSSNPHLSNAPLVEALVELRWKLDPVAGDPHYNVFVGALYEHVKQQYPIHEPLPASLIPQPAIQNVVQHRFRDSEAGWPLVQVGPGIVSLNDTEQYSWNDFGPRAKAVVDAVFAAYPGNAPPQISSLLLRYIDAVAIASEEQPLDFLREYLKTKIELPPQLFIDALVSPNPSTFDLRSSFAVESPSGTVSIRFATGTTKGQRGIIWETALRSNDEQLPQLPETFSDWIESAHDLISNWFFKLIEGELYGRFE